MRYTHVLSSVATTIAQGLQSGVQNHISEATRSIATRTVRKLEKGTPRPAMDVAHHKTGPSIAKREVKIVVPHALRFAMRDARDAAVECLGRKDRDGVARACKSLQCDSHKALVTGGDAALCNGGILALGEIGSAAVMKEDAKCACTICKYISALGQKGVAVHQSGVARTAEIALLRMRYAAQQCGNQPLVDVILRSSLDMIGESTAKAAGVIKKAALDAIARGKLKELETLLNDNSALLRSASAHEFPVVFSAELRTLSTLTRAAWMSKDEALANTIILRFGDLSKIAAERQNVDMMIRCALALGKLHNNAEGVGAVQSMALLFYETDKLLEAARTLPGGLSTFMHCFSMTEQDLQKLTVDVQEKVEKALSENDTEKCMSYLQNFRDIGIAFLRRGLPDGTVNVAKQVAGIASANAAAKNLALHDSITDILIQLADFTSQTEYEHATVQICELHSLFPSAWDIVQQHKGIEKSEMIKSSYMGLVIP